MFTLGEIFIPIIVCGFIVFMPFIVDAFKNESLDKQTTVDAISGREYVSKYGRCPMCTDCPDGCPLDK